MMEQQSDMELSEQNTQTPAVVAAFSNVTFCDVQELYTIDSPVTVQFTTSSSLLPNPNDHIGLFRIGWLSTRDYIGLVRVPQQEENTSRQDCPAMQNVTFNGNVGAYFLHVYYTGLEA
jgi:SKICH domain